MFNTWVIYVFAVLAVVGSFAAGTIYNIRRGNRALKWLQTGLKLIGPRSSLRWLGSSVIELKIQKANHPFRQAEILVVLEPRDVPFLWWYHHARGRRDLLVFRGQLSPGPGCEFEVLDRRSWNARSLERNIQARDWKPFPVAEKATHVAYINGEATAPPGLLNITTVSDCTPVRLAVRRDYPQLELQWRLDDVQQTPARSLFDGLRNVFVSSH